MRRVFLVLVIVPIVGIFLMTPIYAENSTNSSQKNSEVNGSNTDWPTFYVTLAEAIFFAATVAFMIQSNLQQKKDSKEWQEQTKTWKKEITYDTYDELRDNHHDLMRLQMEEPDLLDVFKVQYPDPKNYHEGFLDEKEANVQKLKTEKDRKIFNFYMAEFDLFERVLDAKNEDEALEEYEWTTWLLYLEKMSHHWLFVFTYNSVSKIFDPEFLQEINEKIIAQNKEKEDGARVYLEEQAKEQYKDYCITYMAKKQYEKEKQSQKDTDDEKYRKERIKSIVDDLKDKNLEISAIPECEPIKRSLKASRNFD